MIKKDSRLLGSIIAKSGFGNENYVILEFNNWETSSISRNWLLSMGYRVDDIEHVKATNIKGSYKSDIQVEIRVEVKFKHLIDVQNIQVKLISNKNGFNQIDKRYLSKYKVMWDIPDNVYDLLKYFAGEKPPKIDSPRDIRRMFIDEFTIDEQELILDFFINNKTLIISDILKGKGEFSAEWMLVIRNINANIDWVIKPIDTVLNFFGNGDVKISPRGSIKIGSITLQRKGGDNGRKTANMLQFKINPSELFNIK